MRQRLYATPEEKSRTYYLRHQEERKAKARERYHAKKTEPEFAENKKLSRRLHYQECVKPNDEIYSAELERTREATRVWRARQRGETL